MAIQRSDNDFAADGDVKGTAVSVPQEVLLKINLIAEKDLKQWIEFEGAAPGASPKEDFMGPIYKVSAPKNREVFVFRSRWPTGGDCFYFIIYDPKSKRCSKKPAYIYAKWMDGDWGGHLTLPLIRFKDIDRDGEPEMVIQERVHNGTVYNAVLYHFYRINTDLNTTHIFAYETDLFDFRSEDENDRINRQIIALGNGCIRVDVFVEKPGQKTARKKVGEYTMIRSGKSTGYKIIKKVCLDEKYAWLLVTGGEVDDDSFLRDGYRVYY